MTLEEKQSPSKEVAAARHPHAEQDSSFGAPMNWNNHERRRQR
jgi:hypothetical protein